MFLFFNSLDVDSAKAGSRSNNPHNVDGKPLIHDEMDMQSVAMLPVNAGMQFEDA